MPPTRAGNAAQGAKAGSVAIAGRHPSLSKAAIVGAARSVLRDEGCVADLSLTFVSDARMRALNGRWKGKAEPTDVLAFALPGPDGAVTGDIYICPAVAGREARARGIPVRQELVRLVVHGVLHVLGYDHPAGPARTRSAMWRRQERYVRALA